MVSSNVSQLNGVRLAWRPNLCGRRLTDCGYERHVLVYATVVLLEMLQGLVNLRKKHTPHQITYFPDQTTIIEAGANTNKYTNKGSSYSHKPVS